MTYESVSYYSQLIALFLFIGLFAGAIFHAFWPGNAATFRHAANDPLRTDDDISGNGGRP